MKKIESRNSSKYSWKKLKAEIVDFFPSVNISVFLLLMILSAQNNVFRYLE